MQDIVCTVEPYTSHDLARKNAKFTSIPGSYLLNLPVTPCWEGVVSRGEATRLPCLRTSGSIQCRINQFKNERRQVNVRILQIRMGI